MEVKEKQQDVCRLCDKNSDKMYNVFEKNEEGQQIINLIKNCLPVIVYRTDPLSKQICEHCFKSLDILYKFRKTSIDTANKHKEQLRTNGNAEKEGIQLYLGCEYENSDLNENHNSPNSTIIPDKEGLQDASTSTDDLTILCMNCKQVVLDATVVNGEVELGPDLHKILAESLRKNKIITESENEKVLRSRRKKAQPFYHELDDSLCSSLTEFTNTESSQCFDFQSDVDSMDSDHEAQRPSKRRRIENFVEHSRNSMLKVTKTEEPENNPLNLVENLEQEVEYRYMPLSLLQLTLNVINKENVDAYEPIEFFKTVVHPQCPYCKEHFINSKLLAIHETQHMDVLIDEKIDQPLPWHESREYANVRNKWLNYFDENGFDEDDVVIPAADQSLLIPVGADSGDAAKYKDERVVLVDGKPTVNGIALGDYTKEERKAFYQTMRIENINKKFCQLCRYTFKDNWAIESHYFSSACYYTCRYCGMRFNKQRHQFDEHVQEHVKKEDPVSTKIYAASKLNNVVPKVIQPTKVGNYFSLTDDKGQQLRSMMERKTLQPNLQIKEENMMFQHGDSDAKDVITSQSKTGNQAYFCRKCYKVFFKMEEFNIHSKNCDYNQFPPIRSIKSMFNNTTKHHQPNPMLLASKSNGDVTSAGRPIRNCVREIGTYKDELFIPEALLKETVPSGTPQSFVCFICNTPFPTIYSRNSHMRIHKGEMPGNSPSTSQKPKPSNFMNNAAILEPSFAPHFINVNGPRIKQEPLEPQVEIFESEQSFPSIGGGAVSITPISKNPQQKATINPNIMKLVQNNPHLTIKKSPEKFGMPSGSQMSATAINSPDADKSYKCSSCWEAFANKSHLYFHKKNQCEGSRFPCPFCKKRFGTEAAYSSHIFYSHPE